MKNIKYISLLIVGLVLILSGCELTSLDQPQQSIEQDEPQEMTVSAPTTIPASIEEFEMAFHGGEEKEWTTLSFTLAGLSGFQKCRLDDTMIIRDDNTYVYDGGASLCGAEDSERIRAGTWEITNNGESILFDGGTTKAQSITVNGLEGGLLSLSSEYLGLPIIGLYSAN